MTRQPTRLLPRARAASITVSVGLVLGSSALAAPAASALSSTTCQGSSTITYNPGLTNTAQTVQYDETDTFATCLSTDPTLHAGTSVNDVILPDASCLATPSLTTGIPYTVTWNNGQSSTVDLSFTDVIVEGVEQVTGTGNITSGEFTGANATFIWNYLVPDPLQCATAGGVTVQTGTLTAQITGL